MKIAFVIPRFEPQLAGGAEVHCQRLAEKVAAGGYQVEVLTTCARDHFSWKNYYEPGNKMVNGVMVRRFQADSNRVTPRFLMIQRKIGYKMAITSREELWWIEDSIRSRRMEDFISRSKARYDWFIFMPYLFGTTYWGIKATPPGKSLLIPCLHDEPIAYLRIFREMFRRVRGIMFNTYPEIDLARRLYNPEEERISMVSLGFESEGDYGREVFRKKYGIRDPFILFAGRREGGKNIDLLINYYRLYKKHHSNPVKLVLLGSGEVNLSGSDKDNIIDLGYIPAQYKKSAFAAASFFCQPSVNESLSIVTMESWIAGRPVLVNAGCSVTRDHCRRSNGGLWFGDYPEFEECVDFFLTHSETADQMGNKGRDYVRSNYSWDAVMDRFKKSLLKFGASAAPLSPGGKL